MGELCTKKWRKYSALKSTKEFLTPRKHKAKGGVFQEAQKFNSATLTGS
jgi:hypothetical protein